MFKTPFLDAIRNPFTRAGGLYVPSEFPYFNSKILRSIIKLSYLEKVHFISSQFGADMSSSKVPFTCTYSDDYEPSLYPDFMSRYYLELRAGPTGSYTDYSLPFVMERMEGKRLFIIATKGEIGISTLMQATETDRIVLFYPFNDLYEDEMITIAERNPDKVLALPIKGTIQDCYALQKAYLSIKWPGSFEAVTTNSSNWARILFEIPLIFQAYSEMVRNDVVKPGQMIDIVAPAQKFNISLCAHYARKMGLPIRQVLLPKLPSNTPNLERLIYDIAPDEIWKYIYKGQVPEIVRQYLTIGSGELIMPHVVLKTREGNIHAERQHVVEPIDPRFTSPSEAIIRMLKM